MGGRIPGSGRCARVGVFQWPWMTVLGLLRFSSREFLCISHIEGTLRSGSIWFKGRLASIRLSQCRALSTADEDGAPDRYDRVETRWQKYFSNPAHWDDNRAIKKSSTDPDFEHRSLKERLWIDSPWTPSWVRPKLMENWKHGWAIYSKSNSPLKDVAVASPLLKLAVASAGGGREAEELRRLCEEGCLEEALEKLEDLDVKSLHDPLGVYNFLVNDCCNLKALEQAKRLYAHIMDSDFASTSSLGNALVDMFVKCGSIPDARKAFDRLPRREVSSWNKFLSGLVNQGYCEEAIELFEELFEETLSPNRYTFVSVLRACVSLSALTDGKLIHALILETGLESDSAVGKALVHMYLKLGSREDAYEVFMKLSHRDVVTYNALIQRFVQDLKVDEAFVLLEQMQQEALHPDAVTFMNILKGCGSLGALEQGQLLHHRVIQSSIKSDLLLRTTLVDMYAKCRRMEDAWRVFAEIAPKDVVAWNSVIAGYVRVESHQEALSLFNKMQKEGVEPNKVTFLGVLKACLSPMDLKLVDQIHGIFLEAGSEMDVALGTALVDAYVQCGNLKEALQLFEKLSKDHLAVWNTMLAGYSQTGQSEEAIKIFQRLLMEGLKLDQATFIAVLKACADLAALEWGKVIHLYIADSGYTADPFVGTTLVDMYFNCGSMEDARNIFDRLLVRDVVAWDTMIAGYAQLRENEAALRVFQQMQEDGVQPDNVTFSRVLNACADSANLEEGKKLHKQASTRGYDAAVVVGNSLIDMYAKCGSLETARDVFNRIPEKTLVSWNAMLAGYAQHGQGLEALNLFKQMHADGVEPDSSTYVSMLSACSHSGLVDEGLQFFKSMTDDHRIAPTKQHYACVADLLGRAGRLDEAQVMIERMPFELDTVIWLSLLSASKRYSNLEVGKRAFNEVLRLEPDNHAAYVLLRQLFGSASRWDGVAEIREQMKIWGLKKQLGYSWIATNNEVNTFLPGDFRHPEYKKIYATLHRVQEMVRKVGYRSVPVPPVGPSLSGIG